jgi:DNA polymerase/3'-5' exonuclease PolX
MNLQTAQCYARHILVWLAPTAERCFITGSIRRERPAPADVDLCLIPKLTIYRDMFQVEQGRQNHTWQLLVNYVNNFSPAALKSGQQQPKLLTGGDKAGHRMTIQLLACQLDLWFASEQNWVSKQVNSTGSKEHNIWVAQRCVDRGLHWFVSHGLARLADLHQAGIPTHAHDAPKRARAAGLILPCKDESDFYAHLGLAYIRPQDRELPWLTQNIDSGL